MKCNAKEYLTSKCCLRKNLREALYYVTKKEKVKIVVKKSKIILVCDRINSYNKRKLKHTK